MPRVTCNASPCIPTQRHVRCQHHQCHTAHWHSHPSLKRCPCCLMAICSQRDVKLVSQTWQYRVDKPYQLVRRSPFLPDGNLSERLANSSSSYADAAPGKDVCRLLTASGGRISAEILCYCSSIAHSSMETRIGSKGGGNEVSLRMPGQLRNRRRRKGELRFIRCDGE